MPTIPTRPGPQVVPIPDQTPFANPNIPSGAFGGQIAQAIGGLGQSLETLSAKLEADKEQDNRRKAKNLEVLYRERIRELEFGTETETGYLATQGGEAVDGFEGFQTANEKARQEILSGIDNPNVAAFFRNSSGTLLQASLEGGQRHQLSQRSGAAAQASASRIAAATNDAALKNTDLSFVRSQEALVKSEALIEGSRLGLDPVTINNMKEEAVSTFWMQVIVQAAETNTAYGMEIFEEQKQKLLPAAFQKVNSIIEDFEELDKINLATADILATPNINLQDANVEAREIEDSAVQKGVLRQLKNTFEAKKLDRIEAERQTTSTAFELIQNGGSVDEIRRTNPDQWAAINAIPGLPDKLITAESQRIKGEVFAPGVHIERMEELRALAAKDLVLLTTSMLKGELNQLEFNEIIRLQVGAKASLAKDESSIAVFNSSVKALELTAPDGVDFNNPEGNKESRAVTNQVINELMAWREEFKTLEGKPPTPNERRNQAAALWQTVGEDEGLFGFLDFSFDTSAELRRSLPPEERAVFTPELEDLSESFIADTKESLVRRGIQNPSDLMVRSIAGAMLMNDQGRVFRIMGEARAGLQTPPATVPRKPLPGQEESFESIAEDVITETEEVREDITTIVEEVPSPEATSPLETPVSPPEPVEDLSGGLVPPVPGSPSEINTAASKQITIHEGRRNVAYTDSEGIKTVGVGFNLESPNADAQLKSVGASLSGVLDGDELSDEQVETLFQQDLAEAKLDAEAVIPNFNSLSPKRKVAFTDMAFNLGRTKLAGFKEMIVAIKIGDFDQAAEEAQFNTDKNGNKTLTKWFKQVKRRGARIVSQIKVG